MIQSNLDESNVEMFVTLSTVKMKVEICRTIYTFYTD